MKHILIADQTLRLRGASLSFKEKLELARALERAGVDVVEAPALADEKADALTVRTLAALLRDAVLAVPAGLTEESALAAWEALKKAEKPRLTVAMPISPAGLEYTCGLKAPAALERISRQVAFCASLCPDTEFSAEDATRAEPEFLAEAMKRAAAAGARTITLCDSACLMLPDEMSPFIRKAAAELPATVTLSVEAADDMGLGAACAIAAAREGAGELKSAVGASRPELGTLSQVLRSRGDHLGLRCSLDMTGIQRCLKQISALFASGGQRVTPYAGGAAVTAELAGAGLDANADLAAVSAAVRGLGYELSGDDLARVREAVLRIAAYKPVGARELDVIVAGAAQQVPATYKLARYVVNSGNVISATAHVELEKDGRVLGGLSAGDGPIDAAFFAIEQIIGHHYELDDFQIQSVTEGHNSMGSALVKLRDRGTLYSGEGLSTDIIGAAIHAYLNALNKIVYEGNRT